MPRCAWPLHVKLLGRRRARASQPVHPSPACRYCPPGPAREIPGRGGQPAAGQVYLRGADPASGPRKSVPGPAAQTQVPLPARPWIPHPQGPSPRPACPKLSLGVHMAPPDQAGPHFSSTMSPASGTSRAVTMSPRSGLGAAGPQEGGLSRSLSPSILLAPPSRSRQSPPASIHSVLQRRLILLPPWASLVWSLASPMSLPPRVSTLLTAQAERPTQPMSPVCRPAATPETWRPWGV